MSLYPCRDTKINPIFILQLKTGLRKTSARKNGNATPLRNGRYHQKQHNAIFFRAH